MAQQPDVTRRTTGNPQREGQIRRGMQPVQDRQVAALDVIRQAKEEASRNGDSELVGFLARLQVGVESGESDVIERVLNLQQQRARARGPDPSMPAELAQLKEWKPGQPLPGPFDVGPRQLPGMRERQQRGLDPRGGTGISHQAQIAANALDWAALAAEIPRFARGAWRFAAKRVVPWIATRAAGIGAASVASGPAAPVVGGVMAGLTTLEGLALARHLFTRGGRNAVEALSKDIPLTLSRVVATPLEVVGGAARLTEGVTDERGIDPVTAAWGVGQMGLAGLPGSGVGKLLARQFPPVTGRLPEVQASVTPRSQTSEAVQRGVAQVQRQGDGRPVDEGIPPPTERGTPDRSPVGRAPTTTPATTPTTPREVRQPTTTPVESRTPLRPAAQTLGDPEVQALDAKLTRAFKAKFPDVPDDVIAANIAQFNAGDPQATAFFERLMKAPEPSPQVTPTPSQVTPTPRTSVIDEGELDAFFKAAKDAGEFQITVTRQGTPHQRFSRRLARDHYNQWKAGTLEGPELDRMNDWATRRGEAPSATPRSTPDETPIRVTQRRRAEEYQDELKRVEHRDEPPAAVVDADDLPFKAGDPITPQVVDEPPVSGRPKELSFEERLRREGGEPSAGTPAPSQDPWTAGLADDTRRAALLAQLRAATSYSDADLTSILRQSFGKPSQAVDQARAWIRGALDPSKIDDSVKLGGQLAPIDNILTGQFKVAGEVVTPRELPVIGQASAKAATITPEQIAEIEGLGLPTPGRGTTFEQAQQMIAEGARIRETPPPPADVTGGTNVTSQVMGQGEAGVTPHTSSRTLDRSTALADPVLASTQKVKDEFKAFYTGKGLTPQEVNAYWESFTQKILRKEKPTASGRTVPDVAGIRGTIDQFWNRNKELFEIGLGGTGEIGSRGAHGQWFENVLRTPAGGAQIAVARRSLEHQVGTILERVRLEGTGRSMWTPAEFRELERAFPTDIARTSQQRRMLQKPRPSFDITTPGGVRAKEFMDELFKLDPDHPHLYQNPVTNQLLRMQFATNTLIDQRRGLELAFSAEDPAFRQINMSLKGVIDRLEDQQRINEDLLHRWLGQAVTPVRPAVREGVEATPAARIASEATAQDPEGFFRRGIETQPSGKTAKTRARRSDVQPQLLAPTTEMVDRGIIPLEAGSVRPGTALDQPFGPGMELRTTGRMIRAVPTESLRQPQADTFLKEVMASARNIEDHAQMAKQVVEGVTEVYAGIPSPEAISQMLSKMGAGSRLRGASMIGTGAMGAEAGFAGGGELAEEMNLTGPAAQVLRLTSMVLGGTLFGAAPRVLRGSYQPKEGFGGARGFLRALSSMDNAVRSEILPTLGRTMHNYLLSGASAVKAATGASGATALEGLIDIMDSQFIRGQITRLNRVEATRLSKAQLGDALEEARDKLQRGKKLFSDVMGEWKNFWLHPSKSLTIRGVLNDPTTPQGRQWLKEMTGDENYYSSGKGFLGEALQTQGKASAVQQGFMGADLANIKFLRDSGRTLSEAQKVTLAGEITSETISSVVKGVSPTSGSTARGANTAAQRAGVKDPFSTGSILGKDIFDIGKRYAMPVPRISGHIAEGATDAAQRLFRGKSIPGGSPTQELLRGRFGQTPRDLANLTADTGAALGGYGTSEQGLDWDPRLGATAGLFTGKRVLPWALGQGLGEAIGNPSLGAVAKGVGDTVLDIVNPVTERLFRDPFTEMGRRALPAYPQMVNRMLNPKPRTTTPSAIDEAVRSGESPPFMGQVPSIFNQVGTLIPQIQRNQPTRPPITNQFTGQRAYNVNPFETLFGGTAAAASYPELQAEEQRIRQQQEPLNAERGVRGIGQGLFRLGSNVVGAALQTPQSMFEPPALTSDQQVVMRQGRETPSGGPIAGVPPPSTGLSPEPLTQVDRGTGETVRQPPPIELLQELRQIHAVLNEVPNRMLALEQLQFLKRQNPELYHELRSDPAAYRRWLADAEEVFDPRGVPYTLPTTRTGGRP